MIAKQRHNEERSDQRVNQNAKFLLSANFRRGAASCDKYFSFKRRLLFVERCDEAALIDALYERGIHEWVRIGLFRLRILQ